MCGEPRAEHVGERADPRRLGRAPPRPRRARLRRPPRPHGHHAARDQPRAARRGGRARARDPQRVRPPRRGDARRPHARRPSTRTCRRARSSCRSTTLEIVCRSTPLPFQLDEENVDETLRLRYRWLDLRREKLQRNIAPARADGRDHPPRDGGRRLPRHPDADPLQADARGRARLRRPEPPAAGPLLRAAAEPADPQAADDGGRLRPLLPDRDLLPGRGSPRRPRAGDHAARRRDVVPRPGVPVRADGADVRAHLARVPRDRDPDAVPAHDLRRGRPPLRQRQARHCASGSRSRTRPR